jgi:hypothetical protein
MLFIYKNGIVYIPNLLDVSFYDCMYKLEQFGSNAFINHF